MSRSTFFLTALLLSFWAAVIGAEPPPKRFHKPITYVQPGGWSSVATDIAKHAQGLADKGRSDPSYDWLFDPRHKTVESRSGYLERFDGMLNALRNRERQMGTTPKSLDRRIKDRLQAELDVFLHTCVLTIQIWYEETLEKADEESEIDVPKLVKQCNEEFKVSWGVEGEEMEINGVLSDEDGTIEKMLDSNYEKCIARKYTRQYCRYQRDITVDGKTMKAKASFNFQLPSRSELFQGIRSVGRSYFRPGQPNERPPIFRGGAKPQPVFFRPP